MKLGKGLTTKDLDSALAILKSSIGKVAMPQVKTELEKQSLGYLKGQIAASGREWTVEEVMADMRTAPKLLEVFELAGLKLEEIVQRAIDEYDIKESNSK